MSNESNQRAGADPAPATYGLSARALHWLMAILIILQIIGGLIMTYDGPKPNIWATISSAIPIYDSHKVLGLVLLALVGVRLVNRVLLGVPGDDPQLATWQREVSHLVHGWMYLLLVLVPLLGWIGISMYPALVVYNGGLHLPAIMAPDRAASAPVFVAHALAGYALGALICLHIAAALFHHFIRRDGTLRRMLPGLRTRQR